MRSTLARPAGRLIAIAAALLFIALLPVLEDVAESSASAPARTARLVGRPPTTLGGKRVAVALRTLRPMPPGFVGVSVEYNALSRYAGLDGHAVNEQFVELVRNLAPGQHPVLRIGGNSTDWSWWPFGGITAPPIASYRLSAGWLAGAAALTRELHAHVILGVNLAADEPRLSRAEGRALIEGLGRQSIDAMEIGNEADVYPRFPRYRIAPGRFGHVRTRSYSLRAFTREFSLISDTLPDVPLAGPAFQGLTWLRGLRGLLLGEPTLRVVTIHRYPLSCFRHRGSRRPSIANLLAEPSSHGLAAPLASYVALAHAGGRLFRVDELNSVACGGKRGVSDTFAAALWILDTLFEMDRVGVDGVNIHTFPGARYQLFSFNRTAAGWSARVRPEYYGALMFARAEPAGSRLLDGTGRLIAGVKTWVSLGPDQRLRYVLINKSSSDRLVFVHPPARSRLAYVQRLLAPRVASKQGTVLSGPSSVSPRNGGFAISVPAYSAALLDVIPG